MVTNIPQISSAVNFSYKDHSCLNEFHTVHAFCVKSFPLSLIIFSPQFPLCVCFRELRNHCFVRKKKVALVKFLFTLAGKFAPMNLLLLAFLLLLYKTSPPSRAEVKNAWSCTSTPPIRLHGAVLILAQGQLYLIFNYLFSQFPLCVF
jgi:hypothetical protein